MANSSFVLAQKSNDTILSNMTTHILTRAVSNGTFRPQIQMCLKYGEFLMLLSQSDCVILTAPSAPEMGGKMSALPVTFMLKQLNLAEQPAIKPAL